MGKKFKRTNQTDLTDDELILFDVLFDSVVPINALKSGEEFLSEFNCPGHDLDAAELKAAIEKFVGIGVMRLNSIPVPKTGQRVASVGLTEKGGLLWERERAPIWEKYVSDCSSDETGFWELSVYSPSLEIAREFVEASHECHLYELKNPGDLKILGIDDKKRGNLIPWKTFDKLYKISSRLSDAMHTENSPPTDWETYREKMKWWRNVEELQTP